MTTEQLSYCRICAASCGIVVTVDGDQVISVRGDSEHPVSHGYTCPKGRALPALHHHADRIDEPRVDGRPVDWGTALDNLAGRLQVVIDGHGPDAVGAYLGTGLAYDVAGWVAANGWLAAIGSSRLFTPATIDNAPVLKAAELVAGHPQANPVCDFTATQLVLIVGSNPVVSHGYGTAFADPITQLRSVRRRGGAVWVLDPRRTETAALADHHVALRPGSDAIVLGWLVRERLAAPLSSTALEATRASDREALAVALRTFTLERAAAAAGIEPTTLIALRDALLAADGALAAWCGTGVTMSRDGLIAEWLRWVLLAISGSLDTAHGMHFHRGLLFPLRPLRPTPSPPVASRPELRRWIGQDPCVALGDEIGAGHLRALVVAGANPITAFPDPAASRTGLKALETLAVADVIENEVTTFATHVLPVAGQLERADVPMHEHVALRGGTCYSPPAVSLAGARQPAWWVFAQLAGHMTGVDLFGRSPDELTDDDVLALIARRSVVPWATIRAAGPHGVAIEPDIGWLRTALLDGEPWRLAPDLLVDRLDRLENPDDGLVLVPRRRMRANNSVADPIEPDREALVLLHPLDGAIAGVVDGGTVALTSRHGRVESTVRFDTGLRRGVVSMSHGDRLRSSAALVSARDEIDDLTGMPRASGIPIKVEAVDR